MPRKVLQHVVIFKLENFSDDQLALATAQTAAMAKSSQEYLRHLLPQMPIISMIRTDPTREALPTLC